MSEGVPPAGAKPVSAATGIVTVVMTLLGWSSVPLFIAHFAEKIDVWTSNGWRYGFSAFLWAPVLVWGWSRGKRDGGLPAGLWRAALVPALVNSLGQVAFAWSYYNVDPTTATFGLRMQIVFVTAGAYLLFPSERAILRTKTSWVGIAMVLMGIMGTILFAPRAPMGAVAGPGGMHALGVLLAIFSGLCFAAYALAVRHFMHGYHPVTAFAAISQYTALALVTLMVVAGRDSGLRALDTSVLSHGQVGVLLVSAVIGIALGHVFYYISIARLGVAVSSGVVQLQPFLVAVGTYLVFGKPLTGAQIAAGTVAVVGAVLLLSVQHRLSRAARRELATHRAKTMEEEGVELVEEVGG